MRAVAEVMVHATTVAIEGRGVMIMGASGRGKSGLALELMALGAVLVADDQTRLHIADERLVASCPPALYGMIEARGIGLLHAAYMDEAALWLCVDLDTDELDRLPQRRAVTFMELSCDLVRASHHRHFPSAIIQYVRHGRRE